MGTILNGQAEVFQTIAAGVAKHQDVQLVLSIGDQLEPERIGPVPRNAITVQRAPQLELLKLAWVCITHSGLNAVLESLAQDVPQVAIPVTFDQPGIAARIACHETAVVTSLEAAIGSGEISRNVSATRCFPIRIVGLCESLYKSGSLCSRAGTGRL